MLIPPHNMWLEKELHTVCDADEAETIHKYPAVQPKSKKEQT